MSFVDQLTGAPNSSRVGFIHSCLMEARAFSPLSMLRRLVSSSSDRPASTCTSPTCTQAFCDDHDRESADTHKHACMCTSAAPWDAEQMDGWPAIVQPSLTPQVTGADPPGTVPSRNLTGPSPLKRCSVLELSTENAPKRGALTTAALWLWSGKGAP